MTESSKFQIDIIEGRLKDPSRVPDDIINRLCKSFNFSKEALIKNLKGGRETILICDQEDVESVIELLSGLGISAEAQLAETLDTQHNSDVSILHNKEPEEVAFDIDTDSSTVLETIKDSPTNTSIDLCTLSFEIQNDSPPKKDETHIEDTVSVSEDDDDLLFPVSPPIPHHRIDDDDLNLTSSQSLFALDSADDDSLETSNQKLTNSSETSPIEENKGPHSDTHMSNLGISFDEEDNEGTAPIETTPIKNISHEAPLVSFAADQEKEKKNKNVQDMSTLELTNKNLGSTDQNSNVSSKNECEQDIVAPSAALEIKSGTPLRTPFISNHTEDKNQGSHRLSPSQTLRLKRAKQMKQSALAAGGILLVSCAVWLLLPSTEEDTNDTFVTEAQIKKILDTDNDSGAPTKKEQSPAETYEGKLSIQGSEGTLICKIRDNTLQHVSFNIEKKDIEKPSENEYITGVFEPKFVSLRADGEITSDSQSLPARVSYKQGKDSKKLISTLYFSYSHERSTIKIYSLDQKDSVSDPENAQLKFVPVSSPRTFDISTLIEVSIHKIEISDSQNRSISDLIDSQLKKAAPKEDKKSKKNKAEKKPAE